MMWFRWDHQSVRVDIEVNLTLHFDSCTFSFLENFLGNYFRIYQTELLTQFQSSSFSSSYMSRHAHSQHDCSVSAPFYFRDQCFTVVVLSNLFESCCYCIFFFQFVDVNDLASVFECTSADQCCRIFRVSTVLFYVVVSEVSCYRSHVVFISFEDVSIAYAALDLSGDTVAVSFRIFS